MPKSAYIHIPFCLSKCKYCSFVSYTLPPLGNEEISLYINALISEISHRYKNESLDTLYFGGGTPSLVPAELLKRVIQLFNFTPNAEITIEVNPDSVNEKYFEELKGIGFNRVSIGSQTFDDNTLKLIGRRHNAEQIVKASEDAKSAGFENVSLDLIYGLPTQTLDGLEKDLEKFLDLDIKHISTYGLKIEEGSYFGKKPPSDLPDDDMQADMYILVNDLLEKNGFLRYEVSNFAKSGYESRHNLNYWNNSNYYGFGVAAHGYEGDIRYFNTESVEDYIKNPLVHKEKRELTLKEKLEEEIFLGFRKRKGIDIELVNKKYGIDFNKKYQKILVKYSDYIEKTSKGYALNLQGILVSNMILCEFI